MRSSGAYGLERLVGIRVVMVNIRTARFPTNTRPLFHFKAWRPIIKPMRSFSLVLIIIAIAFNHVSVIQAQQAGTYTIFSGIVLAKDTGERRPVIIRLNTATGKTDILELNQLLHKSGAKIDVIGWSELKTWSESSKEVITKATILNSLTPAKETK